MPDPFPLCETRGGIFMLLIGLIAFGIGVLVGYVSLRALGWLLVLLCFALSAEASGVYHCHNTSGGGCQFRMYVYAYGTGIKASVSLSGGANGDMSRAGGYEPFNGDTVTIKVYDNALAHEVVLGTRVENGGDSDWYWDGVEFDNYYVNGCRTNLSSLTARFTITYSDGVKETSGPLPPGGAVCWSRTNSTPLTYHFSDSYYNSDGGLVESNNGPEYPAWTNSVPNQGQTGSSSGGNTAPNNPINSGAGAGSTNSLTGGQFANGASNIINTIYVTGAGNQSGLNDVRQAINSNTTAVVSGLSNVSDTVRTTGTNIVNALTNGVPGGTNQGGGWDTNVTALLGAISNNTARATNLMSGMGTNMWGGGTNLLYGNDVMTTSGRGAAVSNMMSVLQGNWQTVFDTNLESLLSATNVAESGGEDLWTLTTLRTNAMGGGGPFQLKVRQSVFWQDLCPWLRLIGVFMITVFSISYIHYRVQEALSDYLGRAPGGGPAESATSFLSWAVGLTAVTTVMAAGPILLGGAISVITGFAGGPIVSPLSEAGRQYAGAYSQAISLGIGILTDIFPLTFAFGVLTYLFVFDNLVVAYILAGQRVIRYLSK